MEPSVKPQEPAEPINEDLDNLSPPQTSEKAANLSSPELPLISQSRNPEGREKATFFKTGVDPPTEQKQKPKIRASSKPASKQGKRVRQQIFRIKGLETPQEFMNRYFKKDLVPLRQMKNRQRVLKVK